MNSYQIIVIGASLGGTRALQSLLAGLPENFPLPVVIVLHRGKESDEILVSMLQKFSSLPVSEIEDKDLIVARHVYLAPADYHLLIDDSYEKHPESSHEPKPGFALSIDAPVQRARPSIDVLFESAAAIYQRRVIGIILTGASHDGAKGLSAIKRAGGLTVVQDPATAESATMPAAASCQADQVMPLEEIAPFLVMKTGHQIHA